ncbi:hypothetical protein SVI_2614 [Shewanella violacea DSS12]|uniref:Uncharacterized protein n=1 Tax=Shewanella violacea (strain JCM 10179 / CIP 106290 / LMG 19151 / DSS12) TaxID=637905 RepID=D4ZLN6_SHEVD|nr:hypothetical protein SVI_2614 [Shewanella violacea DSS12]
MKAQLKITEPIIAMLNAMTRYAIPKYKSQLS